MCRPLYFRGRGLPIVRKSVWAPGPVLTVTGNFASTEIRSPDRASRSDYSVLAHCLILRTENVGEILRSVPVVSEGKLD